MNRSIIGVFFTVFVISVFAALVSCELPGGGSGDPDESGAKALTAFSFTSPAATGDIDEDDMTIAVTVPDGTDTTALVATFTTTGYSVKVGNVVQVSGTTANDFTDPVTYTVTAEDGTTADYAVTVTTSSEGGGDGDASFWYGRSFGQGIELYGGVVGGADAHKFAYTDFDHAYGCGILSGGSFYYLCYTDGAVYEVVAGASNDTAVTAYTDIDSGNRPSLGTSWAMAIATGNFALFKAGPDFSYAVKDSATSKYRIYRLVAGNGNDVLLYDTSAFDLTPGSLTACSGDVYYKAGTTLENNGWYRLSAGTDTFVTAYADYDATATYSTTNFVTAGTVYARNDYTRGGLVHIVAGTGNDTVLIAAGDLDGDLPSFSDGSGVHFAKPDAVTSGYDFFPDQD